MDTVSPRSCCTEPSRRDCPLYPEECRTVTATFCAPAEAANVIQPARMNRANASRRRNNLVFTGVCIMGVRNPRACFKSPWGKRCLSRLGKTGEQDFDQL